MIQRITYLTTALLACSTLSACSDSLVPTTGRPVTVSFSAAPGGVVAAGASGFLQSSRSVTATSGSNVLVISRVQLVLARIELERVAAGCASSTAAGDDVVDEHECAELELAPSLVDLPVNGTMTSALSVTVPPGSYSAVEGKIRALRADGDQGTGSRAFLAAHPELAGVSVIVTGTFNGKSFTYTGAPRAEFEATFTPPLVVDAAPVNLTVSADVTTWFKTQSGTLIDPSTANAGGASAGAVADNIRRSFKAFRDDDRDGHDDDRSHS